LDSLGISALGCHKPAPEVRIKKMWTFFIKIFVFLLCFFVKVFLCGAWIDSFNFEILVFYYLSDCDGLFYFGGLFAFDALGTFCVLIN